MLPLSEVTPGRRVVLPEFPNTVFRVVFPQKPERIGHCHFVLLENLHTGIVGGWLGNRMCRLAD